MKFRRYYLLPAALCLVMIASPPSIAQSSTSSANTKSSHESRQEQTVEMSQVPRPAVDAAQKALGTSPTDAKVIVGTSPQEYVLMAKSSSGKKAKVHVLADGTVMRHGKPERDAGASAPKTR